MKIIAGPCLLQDDYDMLALATSLRDAGADVFRGKCWGGGTHPPKDKKFWGLGQMGLATMRGIQQRGISVAIEVQAINHLHAAMEFGIDNIWIAARSMQNYTLLPIAARECRANEATLMIKRSPSASFDDVCGAVEYMLHEGYPVRDLWFIERGICSIDRTPKTRWRPDLLIVPQLKQKFKSLKVMVDCSHSVGERKYVLPIAKAAKGVGADGIMVEVFEPPKKSWGDPDQAISLKQFEELVKEVK